MRKKILFVLALAGVMASDCDGPSDPAGGNIERATPAPGTPTIDSLKAGDKQITVYFSHSGYMPHYSSLCNKPDGSFGNSVAGGSSPIVVTGLVNDIEYSCAVWAFNSSNKTSPGSAFLKATPKAPAP